MHYDISFPHLGITLDHVGKSVDLFGVSIAYYGIIIGMAILIGFAIATSEAKRTRQNPEDYLDMGIIGVIAGIAGARIYYVIFSWDMYKDDLLDIFNLREGGLAIYGGVIAAVISVFVLAKVKHLSPFQIFDTIAMALLNGQMLGRWGNFFNREAFGEYTLRRFYTVCALLVGGGTFLVGAAPAWGGILGMMLVQGVLEVWLLHADQRLNALISSDQRATLISVDSMAYSILMIPASPFVGAVGDLFGQAGAGLALLGVLTAASGAAVLAKRRS